jgi:hypothetical protein
MSLHRRLRISLLRIPVVGARIRNAFGSRSPISSQTRIIFTICRSISSQSDHACKERSDTDEKYRTAFNQPPRLAAVRTLASAYRLTQSQTEMPDLCSPLPIDEVTSRSNSEDLRPISEAAIAGKLSRNIDNPSFMGGGLEPFNPSVMWTRDSHGEPRSIDTLSSRLAGASTEGRSNKPSEANPLFLASPATAE